MAWNVVFFYLLGAISVLAAIGMIGPGTPSTPPSSWC